MSRWGEQLDLLIRSRTPILWIHQQEEERLIRLLAMPASSWANARCCAGISWAACRGCPITKAMAPASR